MTAIATVTTINLLPWREERRQQQQQDFIVLLAIAALLGGAVFWGWKMAVDARVSNQNQRIAYINKEISQLDAQIKEIKEIENERAQLISQMDVIQGLQNERPSIVYFFEEFVRTLPEGVYFKTVDRAGPQFSIDGIAESNKQISELMRNLDKSDWFQKPNLIGVKSANEEGTENRFQLNVGQELAKNEAEESAEAEGRR